MRVNKGLGIGQIFFIFFIGKSFWYLETCKFSNMIFYSVNIIKDLFDILKLQRRKRNENQNHKSSFKFPLDLKNPAFKIFPALQ